jgi:hypothetical protein
VGVCLNFKKKGGLKPQWEDRKHFWETVQTECYFKLVGGKERKRGCELGYRVKKRRFGKDFHIGKQTKVRVR